MRESPTHVERDSFGALLADLKRKESEIEVYNAADTLQELKVAASYRVALAAAHLMSSFRRRRMPGLFLAFLRVTSPRRFESWWRKNNDLFSECLLFVVEKLISRFRCGSEIGSLEAGNLQMELTTLAVVQYSCILRMNQHEKDFLKEAVTQVLLRHEDEPPKDDADRLHRITAALGRKPSMAEVGLVTRRGLLGEALSLVGPIAFDANYERLLANTKDE